ncbi:hypothetical protein F8S13_05740 [Chloroflexia bacterium SDU3-3]|nr:hypothetical protein F8S13_05740 [Chloroflexia bacterium SDU3-3]
MTTTPTLRPMTITEILDGAFRIYRKHVLTFIGIAALLQVPMIILYSVFMLTIYKGAMTDLMSFTTKTPTIAPGTNPLSFFPTVSYFTMLGFGLLLGLLQGLIIHNLISGALARAIASSYIGEPMGILEAYRIGWKRFFSLIAASILPSTISFILLMLVGGVLGLIIMLGVMGNNSSNTSIGLIILGVVLAGLFMIAAFVVSIIVYIRFMLSTQAVMLEDAGPIVALRRSWNLTKGGFWRAVGLVTIMGIIIYFVAGIPGAALNMAIQLAIRDPETVIMWSTLGSVLNQLGLIIAMPLQFATYTLLYYDQRVRKEAFDLELKIQQAAL